MKFESIFTFFSLFLIHVIIAYHDCSIQINGREIPVISQSDLGKIEINCDLPENLSIASYDFHQSVVIPFQKKLGLTEKPIVCFLTNNHSAVMPIEGPVYYIEVQKDNETEGCITGLLHEIGHLWIKRIKDKALGITTNSNPGMINYALKMKDNFTGFGVCAIISALLFWTTSQYSEKAYIIPIAYGLCRIIEDIVKGHYYNYCRRLEEELCDMVIARAFEIKEKRNKQIDRYISSLQHKINQTLEVKFFMFLTGSTHPSNQTRVAQLIKMKDMTHSQIKDLFEKNLVILIGRYKKFYSITGFC